ncbi:MAG: hypothetical protein RR758_02060, partial [Burkholderiaceae bacterium]
RLTGRSFRRSWPAASRVIVADVAGAGSSCAEARGRSSPTVCVMAGVGRGRRGCPDRGGRSAA